MTKWVSVLWMPLGQRYVLAIFYYHHHIIIRINKIYLLFTVSFRFYIILGFEEVPIFLFLRYTNSLLMKPNQPQTSSSKSVVWLNQSDWESSRRGPSKGAVEFRSTGRRRGVSFVRVSSRQRILGILREVDINSIFRDSVGSRKPGVISIHTLSLPPPESLILCLDSSYSRDVYGWLWCMRVNLQGPRGKGSCFPSPLPCPILHIDALNSFPTPLWYALLNASDKKERLHIF